MPYSGTTTASSHGWLQLLQSLLKLSPSHAACVNFKIRQSFNGTMEVVNKRSGGLKYSDTQEALSIAEQEEISAKWEEVGFSLTQAQELTKRLARSYEAVGMAYLHYKEVTVGDTKKVFLRSIDPTHIFYLWTEDMQENVFAVSRYWDDYNWLKVHEPKLIKEFPAWTQTGTTRETIITFKNPNEDNEWYGRPETQAALISMCSEWFLRDMNLKIVSTETVSKLILATMANKPGTISPKKADEKFASFVSSVRPVLTAEGGYLESKSAAILEVPYHEKGIQLHAEKLEVNRDVAHREYSRDTAQSDIHGQHGIPIELTASGQVKNSIGGSYLADLYLITDDSIITPMQSEWESRLCVALNLIAEFAEDESLKNKAIKFDKNIERLVGKLKKDENTDEQRSGQSSENTGQVSGV